MVLGYSRLQSYYVLDFEHYVETKGEARIVHTRNARFPPQLRWPFHELGMDNPDAAHWAQRLFEPEVLQQTPVAGDDGCCMLCGLWATDAEVHCRGCLLGGGRRRHVDGPGCLRARCGGHSFLDVQHNSPLPGSHETSMDYSPSPPHSRDGGVIDSSMDSSSSRFSPSDDIHDDDDMGPPPDDEGYGRRPTDTSLLRPRWRVDLFADTQAPPGHNYGPHFDHGMDSGLVPPRPDLAPSTPMSDRLADDLASSSGRSRSHTRVASIGCRFGARLARPSRCAKSRLKFISITCCITSIKCGFGAIQVQSDKHRITARRHTQFGRGFREIAATKP